MIKKIPAFQSPIWIFQNGGFVSVKGPNEKVSNFKETAASKLTKEAKKMAQNYFQGKNLHFRTMHG